MREKRGKKGKKGKIILKATMSDAWESKVGISVFIGLMFLPIFVIVYILLTTISSTDLQSLFEFHDMGLSPFCIILLMLLCLGLIAVFIRSAILEIHYGMELIVTEEGYWSSRRWMAFNDIEEVVHFLTKKMELKDRERVLVNRPMLGLTMKDGTNDLFMAETFGLRTFKRFIEILERNGVPVKRDETDSAHLRDLTFFLANGPNEAYQTFGLSGSLDIAEGKIGEKVLRHIPGLYLREAGATLFKVFMVMFICFSFPFLLLSFSQNPFNMDAIGMFGFLSMIFIIALFWSYRLSRYPDIFFTEGGIHIGVISVRERTLEVRTDVPYEKIASVKLGGKYGTNIVLRTFEGKKVTITSTLINKYRMINMMLRVFKVPAEFKESVLWSLIHWNTWRPNRKNAI